MRGRQSRTDSPPDAAIGRDAVDEEDWPSSGIAPRQGRPARAIDVDLAALAGDGLRERGGDGRREVGGGRGQAHLPAL
jgi:hypothetical protein